MFVEILKKLFHVFYCFPGLVITCRTSATCAWVVSKASSNARSKGKICVQYIGHKTHRDIVSVNFGGICNQLKHLYFESFRNQILEIRPSIAWNKGKALNYLLQALGKDEIGYKCMYYILLLISLITVVLKPLFP